MVLTIDDEYYIMDAEGLALPVDAKAGYPNCGLVSMAIVARCTLSEATEAYQKSHLKLKKGRKKQGNWRGNTYDRIRANALRNHLGVMIANSLPIYKMVLHRYVANFCEPDKRYIVVTTGHVQVVCNSMVSDQGGTVTMSEYWGRQKQVRNIWEIAE